MAIFGVDGTISKQVWIEKNIDGKIRQNIARAGTTEVNFTNGTSTENSLLQYKAQPSNLPDLILQTRADDDILREEKLVDGKMVLVITLQDHHNPAIEIPSFSKPVIPGHFVNWIDQETGLLWMTQTIFHFEDGTELAALTMRYSTMERVNPPPQDALDIIEKVIP